MNQSSVIMASLHHTLQMALKFVFALLLLVQLAVSEQQDVHDQKIIDLVNFVISDNDDGISTNLMKPIEILDAQAQVMYFRLFPL